MVDLCNWCSMYEMSSLTNWFCWTSLFSESARLCRPASSSVFRFCSYFSSSLSRISLSFLNSVWIFSLSCCIWFFRNEDREREEEEHFLGNITFPVFFFFSLSITFQNNGLKSSLLRSTLSPNGIFGDMTWRLPSCLGHLCLLGLLLTPSLHPLPKSWHWGWTKSHYQVSPQD